MSDLPLVDIAGLLLAAHRYAERLPAIPERVLLLDYLRHGEDELKWFASALARREKMR